VNLALILTAAYLLGAVITYGILIEFAGLKEAGVLGARARRPDANADLIEAAATVAARKVSLRGAIVWPLLLLLVVLGVIASAATHIKLK
jgi:hypothetical protein